MKRRIFVHLGLLTTALLTLPATLVKAAAGHIGKMLPAELLKVTKAGGMKVAAIKPTPAPLSKADEKLLMEVALGGMMQLEVSRLAVRMAHSPEVKAYAEAEVEEQSGLAKKLSEVAAAKKAALPDTADDKTKKELTKLQALSGAEFDRAYIKTGGVAGHKLLKTTMQIVESKAEDATLKTLAATTLPLIETHLQVAEDESSAMA